MSVPIYQKHITKTDLIKVITVVAPMEEMAKISWEALKDGFSIQQCVPLEDDPTKLKSVFQKMLDPVTPIPMKRIPPKES